MHEKTETDSDTKARLLLIQRLETGKPIKEADLSDGIRDSLKRLLLTINDELDDYRLSD